jgi:hypothetical protein
VAVNSVRKLIEAGSAGDRRSDAGPGNDPVDRDFGDAYRYFETRGHFGKVVISHG